jgi:hypothetical protein
MGQSSRTLQPTDNRLLLLDLKATQKECKEGTRKWIVLQSKIDEIVAQNYLHYVNR